jgi:inorganic pyrophosphatase
MSIDPQKMLVHIEIPEGSNIKFEIDEETGFLMVDRMLPVAMTFPANYGLIPETKGKDGDALDVLVFTSAKMVPNSYIKCRLHLWQMELTGRCSTTHAHPHSALL